MLDFLRSKPKTLSPEEAHQALNKDSSIVLIDVRETDEFDNGHIQNALNIPLSTVEAHVPLVVPDKDARIFVYCRSGMRSNQAAKILGGIGYTDVTNIGGVLDWPYGLTVD